MSSQTPSLPYADTTGAPDSPAAAAGLHIPVCARATHEWAQLAGRAIARYPAYLMAGAAATGFVAGRVVKRLLFPHGRQS